MEKQLLKLKGEVQKEQLELDQLQLEVKECSMEQKKKATFLKELKGLSNQASMAGQELQKALSKKRTEEAERKTGHLDCLQEQQGWCQEAAESLQGHWTRRGLKSPAQRWTAHCWQIGCVFWSGGWICWLDNPSRSTHWQAKKPISPREKALLFSLQAVLVAASGLDSPGHLHSQLWGGKPFFSGIGLESPATLSTLFRFGLDCPWCLTVPLMFNVTCTEKFGSLSTYCFVPAMPMEPPTKERRYLKGMELAEADREQYQGWELDNSQDSQVLLEPEGGSPRRNYTRRERRAERSPERTPQSNLCFKQLVHNKLKDSGLCHYKRCSRALKKFWKSLQG